MLPWIWPHTFRSYLCIPSLAGQSTKLHEVISEHRAEVLGAVGVSHPRHQCVLGHRADSQNGLHQSKVTVSEQLGVFTPLTAYFPKSYIWEGPDTKKAYKTLVMIKSYKLFLTVLYVPINSIHHLEKSCLTLSTSLMTCRFLRAGYREDTASKLPLQSSSTSATLWK